VTADRQEAPDLVALVHRLGECPPDFQEAPLLAGRGTVDVAAVVHDVLLDLGMPAEAPFDPAPFRVTSPKQENRLRLILLACWLLHDPWFRGARRFAARAEAWLSQGLNRMASVLDVQGMLGDPDRREELCRACLAALDVLPRGETEAQARDRFAGVDSVERHRVALDMRKAEERAREVREALQRQAAEAAAAKVSRE
jgi:hypothetical protein